MSYKNVESDPIPSTSSSPKIVPQINIEVAADDDECGELSLREVYVNQAFSSDDTDATITSEVTAEAPLKVETLGAANAASLTDSGNGANNGYDFRRDFIMRKISNTSVSVEMNAVKVRNVMFGYGNKATILNNISLTVPKGKIYALLGSSGCGKTTLLRTILGRLTPQSGSITVFGMEPGSRKADIPGKGVGYMPQTLALFTEFTIEETLRYFGLLYHMPLKAIEERTDFLLQLLNLPHKDVMLSKLSGGQKRRASLATTLFHSPPLLILDEPTVGVDPLLRCRIWEYLENICANEGMTVIITTHYIEEARSASKIGFMRFGRLLTQSNPSELMARHRLPTLEAVFLKLCEQDCGEIKRQLSSQMSTLSTTSTNEKMLNSILNSQTWYKRKKDTKYLQKPVDCRRLFALFLKNYLNLKRNPFMVFFFLILPVIQITLFCSSFGKLPRNIPVAIHSPENPANLSALFLDTLDTKMIRQEFYDTLDSAIDSVKRGKAWAAIYMSENFSDAFDLRAMDTNDLTEEEFEDSKIKLYVDFSDSIIGTYLHRSLLMSYGEYLNTFIASLGYNPATVNLPLDTKKPIYGVQEQSIDEFLAPGAIVAIIYSTPLILASFVLVLERQDGLLERSYVAGVRPFEVLLMHLITMMIALFVQIILLMFVSFVLFEVPMRGPVLQVFSLIFLNGLCGITFGLMVSSISPNQSVAIVSSFGLIFPMWMICGVFWPLESVPVLLRQIFFCAPLSYPIQALRYVVSRGWTIYYMDVLIGYIVSAAYNLVLFTATIFAFHFSSA